MTDKTVEITVELLDILAIATKESIQSRTSELVFRLMTLDADMGTEKFLKKAGRTDLEDGMKKLEILTDEWVVLASVWLLKITHTVDEKLRGIGGQVKDVDEKLRDVEGVISDDTSNVIDKVQIIVDGAQVCSTGHQLHR